MTPRWSEINMTPLIDVLLVLLVIFLASLPLSQQGLTADLPPVVQKPTEPEGPTTNVVAVYSADGRLTINQRPVALADGLAAFREIFESRREKTLYIIGDGSVSYGEVMRIIDAATGAGVTRIGIVTEGMRREGSSLTKTRRIH